MTGLGLRRTRASRCPWLRLEVLETRRLLAVSITEFPVPTPASGPQAITLGSDGNLWFTLPDTNRIASINPNTQVIQEFVVPTAHSRPTAIASGPDGTIWFSESAAGKIGIFNLATRQFNSVDLPPSSRAEGITTGPDGNVWYTNSGTNSVGVIFPATLVFQEFAIPTAASGPFGITTGPDGLLWFTEATANQVANINPTTHLIQEFVVPTPGSLPAEITAGPDGQLWFVEASGNNVAAIHPVTKQFSEFAIPTANSQPIFITHGPDGQLWFTESNANRIASIDPTSKRIQEFVLPTANSVPNGIVTGPDNNLWFTEGAANKVARAMLLFTQEPTTTTLTATPNPVAAGQNVMLTATVTPFSGTLTPTGLIQFFDVTENVALGSVPLTNGAASLVVNSLAAGTHQIQATYVHPILFAGSAGTTAVTVTPAVPRATTTTVSVSFAAVQAGTAITFTAQVRTDVAGDLPRGTVIFLVNGRALSQQELADVGGVAQATFTTTAPTTTGSHTVTVRYLGNPAYNASQGIAPFTVTRRSSAATLTVAPNPARYGQTIHFNLSIAPAAGSAGPTPTGSATFFRDGVPIQTVRLSASGQAFLTTTSLPPGTYTVTADYSGDDFYTPATAALAVPLVINTSASTGPTVTGVRARVGFHLHPTNLVVTFSDALDPTTATNRFNYEIRNAKGGRIAVAYATYDATTRTVVLTPELLLDPHRRYTLTIRGTPLTGITDVEGRYLNGRPGQPGTNFVTSFVPSRVRLA